MKKLKLVLKNKIICLLLSILFLCFECFSNNIFFDTINTNLGPLVIRNSKIIVTGDSFAGKFYDYEENKDLTIYPYARAGHTIDQNKIIMAQALNFDGTNVLISIGVNDQYNQTPLYRFESVLRSLLNISLYNKKTVFFHSYLRYFSNDYNQKRFSAEEYDAIIRQLCVEYDNAYYIDVKDLESSFYISNDNIHYNMQFYDELYNRLVNLIHILETAQNS